MPCCSFLWNLEKRRGYGFPDIFRYKGSVLPSCIPIIFCSTLFATIVTVLYLVYNVNLLLPGSLVGTVAVVVGLLLGFSTSNAYDRYYEGRKLFTKMCTHVRNCTRIIWVGIKGDRYEKEKHIKLLLAYVVAVKHHLRWEFETDCSDLRYLLPEDFHSSLYDRKNTVPRDEDPKAPEIAVPSQSDSQQSLTQNLFGLPSAIRTLARRVSPTTLKNLRDAQLLKFAADELAVDVDASMCLPLEIIHHLGLYFGQKFREKKVDGTRFDMLTGSLNTLIEILGDLERIGNTPIPFAYNLHLKQVVTLYVWVLPFTMVNELKWLTIPAIMFISFVLFGVLAIGMWNKFMFVSRNYVYLNIYANILKGAEIENPFGYDENDLPLDDYCKVRNIRNVATDTEILLSLG
ncbi:14861_t:CDS:2 [Dentiscutata erythropus]|uniref:14861_t:CDS:1 n=1 Tax=Dentiscutata erythropus TaxID=1348616 RepID=A0A9N9NB56_9GLOM|nr:14861_t:CDS:2 [Dentiscutata erythropus]